MPGLLRRALPLLFAFLACTVLVPAAKACPFCAMQGQTLTGEVAGADMVLYGTLTNANQDKDTTDLAIEIAVKKHDWLKDRKVVTLPRYVPPDASGQYKFLVFCYVFKGAIDPYRGLALKADSDIGNYLKGLQDHKDQKTPERLKFFFNYLDNPDLEISNDAYKEFALADYKDYRDMAAKLPPERIVKWLKDRNTPSFRIGLYGSLLGHCGKEEDAEVIHSLMEDPTRKLTSGVDGLLAGYVLLKPKEGWQYTCSLMNDPHKDFMLRYSALRTARFFWDYRPDVVSKKELAAGAALLLSQSDMADLAVEDLRKWQCWDMAGRVLALRSTEAFKTPVVRRAVLRYALCCTQDADAAAYVAEQRKQNPQGVSEAEEILKLEQAK